MRFFNGPNLSVFPAEIKKELKWTMKLSCKYFLNKNLVVFDENIFALEAIGAALHFVTRSSVGIKLITHNLKN